MRIQRSTVVTLFSTVAAALSLAGCALYNDVSITPLIMTPATIDRGSDVQQMIGRSDFLRAIELTSAIETKPRQSSAELSALGTAELAAGRYDAARRHLRQALELEPQHLIYANIAWELSQLEYMCNNHAASVEWAMVASEHGLAIKPWHLDYLRALATTQVYRSTGATRDRVSLRTGHPDVPRIDVKLNGRLAPAIIDTGAVLSIISERLAASHSVEPLGKFTGTFFGLLGEPIPVRFGLLKSLSIGNIVLENVPVAIMPDNQMSFLIRDRKPFTIDLLLGTNLLKEFRLDFDFRKSQLTFTYLQPADHNPDPDQNLFFTNFRPLIRGTINHRGWFMFLLDTGSEVTFLDEAQLNQVRLGAFMPRIHNALLQGLGGSEKHGTKLDNVEIGVDRWAGVFRNMPMYTSSQTNGTCGIIGQNFLTSFRMTLDFGRMRVDLQRER
jgi:predicted aspartyl protease